jgi:hypothetical protein
MTRDRARLAALADYLAAAAVMSLPWSTSATSILVPLWLVAVALKLGPLLALPRAPSLTLPRKRGREGWGKRGRVGRGPSVMTMVTTHSGTSIEVADVDHGKETTAAAAR